VVLQQVGVFFIQAQEQDLLANSLVCDVEAEMYLFRSLNNNATYPTKKGE